MRTQYKVLGTLFCGLILSVTAVTVSAAGYIKFDGVDGESTDRSHKDWINLVSIDMGSARPGGTLMGLNKDGKRVRVTRDGRYRVGDGKMIIIINGKVSKVVAPSDTSGKVLTPGQTKGFNPQPEPPAGKAAKVLTPGQTKGFNPQPEPPAPNR